MSQGSCTWPHCVSPALRNSERCYVHSDLEVFPVEQAPAQPGPTQQTLPAPKAPRTLADVFEAALALSARRASGEEKPIETGWAQLDNSIGGGLWPGLHIIVAASGVGKTQLSLQIVGNALAQGIPCGIAELELDEAQIGLRILASRLPRKLGASWSEAYLGRSCESLMQQMKLASHAMSHEPLYLDVSDGMGMWNVKRLEGMAKHIREKHPKGPALMVLDFLQLVGTDEGSRIDVRERIGAASYLAKSISNRYGVAMVLVSSTGRANYQTLSPEMRKTGLKISGKGKREVMDVNTWVGMGKESGEIEFSADSLLVLFRPTLREGDGDTCISELLRQDGYPVVGVIPKLRYGSPSWFAMPFQRGQLGRFEDDTIASLVGERSDSGGSADEHDGAAVARNAVLELVRRVGPGGISSGDLCASLKGTQKARLEQIQDAFAGLQIMTVTRIVNNRSVKVIVERIGSASGEQVRTS